ncbi:MAG: hypothetical protein EZS28_042306, partial [Streblomastix strix]
MRTNVKKPLKSTNTENEQYNDIVRRQPIIDPTAEASRQQGTTGGNFKGNSRTGDKVMEPNIPHAEERRLDVNVGYNICLQPHKGQPTTAAISSLSNIRSQLHTSGNAIWDQYCTIRIRKTDTTNSSESEKEVRDVKIELCGRYNTVQQQQIPDIKGKNTDNNYIRGDWMDNQSEQDQAGSQEINNIPWMELEHGINDAVNNKIDEEIGESSINQISAVDTVATISNHKKRGKADWTNPIYKSSVHTRRTSFHVHKLRNEQESKESRKGQPDQIIEKNIDRGGVVDSTNQEQQTQEYRNTQNISNDNIEYVSMEMESDFTNTGKRHIEDIQTMEAKIPTSNRNETTAILFALNYFQLILLHNHLRFLKVSTDNTTACYNLTKGKAKVGFRRLIDQILLFIEQQQWEVKFRHIPEINNIEVDSLSRLAVSGDYSIDKQMLQQVPKELKIQIS